MKKYFFYAFLFLGLYACDNTSNNDTDEIIQDYSMLPYGGAKADVNELVVHELSDPDKLNPITSQGAGATYIEHNLFMYLLDVDKENLVPTPWLAKERPTITELPEGDEYKLRIDYELREEAVWDNGNPITGYDVAFSFKACKNPHVDAEHQRPYIDFIAHVEVNEENPKKFSLFASEKHFSAEFSSGGVVYIIPAYIYDADRIMEDYTLKELSDEDNIASLRDDPNLIKFATEFNSEKFQREVVVGSGAYKFESWVTGQRIVLSKKENWWGNALEGTLSFENHPNKITYEIINDMVTGITAMKDGSIDIMRGMRPKDFHDLKEDEDFNSNNFLFNPEYMSYTYIGVNMKHSILSDKNVRKALAHCVDVAQTIDIILYGYAKPINSFVHPSKSYYNEDIEPYNFDLEIAAALLEEAGWVDSDGDGLRDKMIDGELTPLSLSIKYNSGNDKRKNISLLLKENVKKIGIELEIIEKEWTVYLDECKNHDFDLYVLGWVQEAILDDPKQLFHTEAYNGGSNYPGFGTAETDVLIENLRQELDEEKRTAYYKELQAIVQDEVPYIMLYTPDNMMAISKRFGNAKPYIARPGYDERELILGGYKGAQQ
ncbi:MAG: ABC transporter substrate-binding protein [Chitinophagales bacterium]